MRIVLSETKKELREYLEHHRRPSLAPSTSAHKSLHYSSDPKDIMGGLCNKQHTVISLSKKLEALEHREAKNYVSRKMFELELKCTRSVLESMKSRLSTSEATLRQCCCKMSNPKLP
jgi:hypothetical protein